VRIDISLIVNGVGFRHLLIMNSLNLTITGWDGDTSGIYF